jgi:hypothetical protein
MPTYAYHGFTPLLGRASYAPPQALDAQGVRNRAIAQLIGKQNIYFGGIGQVSGSVKEKGTPDAPLHRKVWLIVQNSGMVIRETWSNATTGAYEFRDIRQGVPYTVIAFDYTGTYRAVIADNQTEELIV